jgi:hypothetical protein
MPASPAERDEYVEYFSGSGAITCRVLYRTEQLAFVQFRTVDWPGYKDFNNYARIALFPEHLRPANPHSPGVTNFVQALASEAAAQQQHLSNCRQRTNGQGASDMGIHISKSKQENGQRAPAPKACAKVGAGHAVLDPEKVMQRDGVKPLPKPAKTPARQGKARASGEDFHSLKPVRSIAGLTIADFLYDR